MSDKVKKLNMIAGVIFLLSAVLLLYGSVRNIISLIAGIKYYDLIRILNDLEGDLIFVCLVIISVGFFLNNKFVSAIGAALRGLFAVVGILFSVLDYKKFGFWAIAELLLFVAMTFLIISLVNKQQGFIFAIISVVFYTIRLIISLPGTISFFSDFLPDIRMYIYEKSFIVPIIVQEVLYSLSDLFVLAGLVINIVITKEISKTSTGVPVRAGVNQMPQGKVPPMTNYGTPVTQRPQVPQNTVVTGKTGNATNAIDSKIARLKQIKELLDSGAIAQEEYDQMKNQIMSE